jgi:YD repeat-containing protein
LTEAPLLVLHTIPSDAFAPGGGIDPKDVSHDSDDRPRLLVSTDRRRVRATRYTADGYLKSTTWKDNGRVSAYTLPFRSGIIEAASDTVVAPESDRFEERDGFYVHSGSARSAFENYLPQTIEFQKDQNASFPGTARLRRNR